MGKKILIVDDEFYITRSLSFLFGKEGDECRTAQDGETALELVKDDRPDIIFLDVDMPKKDGYETARDIRTKLKMNDVYIIMLTAKGQEIDEKRGLEAGADEYVLKPFDPRALLEKVKNLIG